MSQVRDVLLVPVSGQDGTQLSDIQDQLWNGDATVVTILEGDLMVVNGDPAGIQALLDSLDPGYFGVWQVVSDPEAVPDLGPDVALGIEAWRQTAVDDLVVAEQGFRPDDGASLAGLGGCAR